MKKIAIISGTSYGLGHSIAEKLIKGDFKVYGISRSSPKIKHENFTWIKSDLSTNDGINLIPKLVTENQIDVLINNVGTAFHKKTLEFSDEDFERMFNLNFKSPIKLTKLLFPKLKKGLIVNISSLSDRYPDLLFGLYGSSKAALNLFFETIAAENPKVKVLNILPNYIDTPLQHATNEGKNFDWSLCMTAYETADAVYMAIKDQANFDSGSKLIIDKNENADGVYNPEKLWLYTTASKKFKRVK